MYYRLKVTISQKTLQPHSTQAFRVLVAISECDSLCRPRHSICLQLLIKPITYVHPDISYPSVKSPFLLAPSSPPPHLFPLSPLPVAPFLIFPPPFPIATLSISSSRCPPPHLPLPVAPFQIPPFLSPPPRCHSPLPITSFLSTLPISHFPLPSLLSALASPSASLSPLPHPPQAARITN